MWSPVRKGCPDPEMPHRAGGRGHELQLRLVASKLMTPAEEDPDQEPENQATEAPDSATETPNRLQKAADGIAEAQVWKGQQIARGWRNLVAALRGSEEGKA
jgi:hypothetical protein